MKNKDTRAVMNIKKSRRQARQGQTIVIALLVLLLLAFVGGLFVTIVARNLKNSQTAGVVQTADDYAQSGIKFADDQLMNSVEGADWRPPTLTAGLKDPDYDYINAGYTRYTTGNGRFLIRITYNPLNIGSDPNHLGQPPVLTGPQAVGALSRYIKIESVGREGHVDPTDPTTFRTTTRQTSTAKLLAYKSIGITDYARFVTDVDRRSDIASIGVPSTYNPTDGITTPGVMDFNAAPDKLKAYPITTTLGAADAYFSVSDGNGGFYYVPNPNSGAAVPPSGTVPGGGAFRSNVPVRFFGMNQVYLNRPSSNGPLSISDQMEINGDVILDHYDPTNSATANYLTTQPAQLLLSTAGPTNVNVEPSASPNGFNTFAGAVRDGRAGASGNDANGNPRQIKRLDPPKIDNVDPVTNMTRYRAMAINSAPRPGATGTAGLNGYGNVVYIDNSADVQNESSNINGGFNLADEWLNRQGRANSNYAQKGGWNGNIYTPPGCEIIFGRLPAAAGANAGLYGVTLIRYDSTTSARVTWKQPDGSAGNSTEMYIPFDDFIHSPNWDVVIVAEGNVRVHGIVSANPNSPGSPTASDLAARHVTIVTNATAYVDGNLLKGNPDSSIAVLARDYVCVNTTQFLAGTQVVEPNIYFPTGVNIAASPPMGESATPASPYNLLSFAQPGKYLVQEFSFGLPSASASATYGPSNLALYFSGRSNIAEAAEANFSLYNPRTGKTFAPITPAGNSAIDPTDPGSVFLLAGTFPSMTDSILRTTADISGVKDGGVTSLNSLLDDAPLQLWSWTNGKDTGKLDLERVAILPMDIRIEAVLYAQNKSFFVIPGESFNSDGADTVDAYSKAVPVGGYIRRTGVDNTKAEQSRFPFAGQPIDMKIIVSGAVSEARPADISAQNAWMQKWGWIPQYHGSLIGASGEPAGHVNPAGGPATGLTIIYDPQCAFPYHYVAGTGMATAFRTDANGFPLPFAPRLPVCEGMFYVGQASDDRP